MVVNCQLMSNFLWHFLTKIWKLKFEIEFGISICNASRHHTCNSNAHRRNQFDTDVSNQSVNCRFSILNHSKWTYTQERAKRAYLIIQNQIFEPENNHLHLCAYLDFEHCTNERPQATTIYLYIGIAQKVYAQ